MASFADDLAAVLAANEALISRVTALMETRRRMGQVYFAGNVRAGGAMVRANGATAHGIDGLVPEPRSGASSNGSINEAESRSDNLS